jgi:hypothetical protein
MHKSAVGYAMEHSASCKTRVDCTLFHGTLGDCTIQKSRYSFTVETNPTPLGLFMYCTYTSTLNKQNTLFTGRLARLKKKYKQKSVNLLLTYAIPFVDYIYSSKAEHSIRTV